jgi:hypothetical protein
MKIIEWSHSYSFTNELMFIFSHKIKEKMTENDFIN